MRIIYLHQYFCTPQMSGGTRSYEIGKRLVEAGHKVHMVTTDTSPNANDSGWRVEEIAGMQVHWLPVPYSNHMGFRKRVQAFSSFALKSRKYASRLPGDVVFATSTPLTIAIPAIHVAKKLSIPMVFEVRDLWPELPIAIGALKNPLLIHAAQWLEKRAYAKSTRIVALTSRMKRMIVQHNVPTEHVSVVPNGCDVDLFDVAESEGDAFRQQHSWLGQRPLVVYAGTMGKLNNVEYLADVAGHTMKLDADVRFAVFGGGSEEGKVRNRAEQHRVLDRSFFMMGRTPKTQMPAILSAADMCLCLANPGKIELALETPNKVFDAMAASRPISLNYGGEMTDLVVSQDMGLHLDADPAVAAASLVEKLHDKLWLREAGRRSGQTGRERFHRDLLASRIEDTLLAATGISKTQPTRAAA